MYFYDKFLIQIIKSNTLIKVKYVKISCIVILMFFYCKNIKIQYIKILFIVILMFNIVKMKYQTNRGF
jgi:hypothetical protein